MSPSYRSYAIDLYFMVIDLFPYGMDKIGGKQFLCHK